MTDRDVRGSLELKGTIMPAATAAALLLTPLLVAGQQPFDLGKREYESNCAVCNGAIGKGDGPYI